MAVRRATSVRRATRRSRLRHIGPLRVYTIEGLYGRDRFSFELDKHEPTLLTGVNGTGKSTILRTIDAISASRWSKLVDIPFKRIVLNFESVEVEVVRKITAKGSSELTVHMGDLDPWTFQGSRHYIHPNSVDEAIGRGASVHFDEKTGLHYLIEDESMYWLNRDLPHLRQPVRLPGWLEAFSAQFSVLFVTDQRLVIDPSEKQARGEKTPTRVAVEEVARLIYREIQRTKSQYATVAQERDGNFPVRLVEAMGAGSSPRSPRALANDLEKLGELRRGLEATGLLAAEEGFTFEQLDLDDPSIHAVIDTYVKDTIVKLETLEPLRLRLQLFTDFLNQHYSSKQVIIDQESGFRIEVEGVEKGLPPAQLSSGEQQMLVLAHKILFGTKPGTLVLIDEPELSLHVIWQATFIEDLARMGEVDGLSFLLATHSPTLINGREDLKRSLDSL